jgi:putative phosphoesterase
MLRIGVISDTHGLLRPRVLEALTGAQHLVHAGDVGTAAVLEQLRKLAPLTAVRGNNDVGRWSAALPAAVTFELAGVRLHLLHNIADLSIAPAELGVRAVIAGHSHRPAVRESGGVLYLNPGSAGPRRFNLPVSVAWLEIEAGKLQARLVSLTETQES